MGRGTKETLFCTNAFPLKNRLSIAVGEGIGPYVVQKSLNSIKPKKNFQIVVWSHKDRPLTKPKHFQIKRFRQSVLAFKEPFQENTVLEIVSNKSSYECLKEAAKFCISKKSSALITGPINKKSLGRGLVGQTDLLKKMTKNPNAFMLFRGNKFNVSLLNDHLPLKHIKIDKKKLLYMLDELLYYRKILKKENRKKPIAVLGINPHAGEFGLLGTEENKIIKPLLKKYIAKGLVEGPLVPDAAFFEKNWSRYSFYLSMYHDQGLIPFKMIHKHKGFAMSVGLPILRLGVDHGTGEGLKKHEISHDSFLAALKESMNIINGFKVDTVD